MADRSGGMVTTNIRARLVRPERSLTWQPLRQHASQFLPKKISLVLLCMDENHVNLKMMSWSSGYGVEVIGQRDLRRKRSLWKGKELVCLRCNRCFYFYPFLDKIYFSNSFACQTCNSIFRVEEYIISGRDKTIVDPEPTGLYTKRKQQIEDSLNTDPVAKVDVVNYPESGWGNSLEKMPMFTRAEMNEHIARSERIAFDSDYWRNLQTELLNY